MASRNLEAIAERLIAGGRRSDEPVAVVSRATSADQQVVVSTLGEVATAAAGIQAPAIVVIGEVVRLRARLDWIGALGRQPLQP
jgi:uroporphyrin-III C-methyltransferase